MVQVHIMGSSSIHAMCGSCFLQDFIHLISVLPYQGPFAAFQGRTIIIKCKIANENHK